MGASRASRSPECGHSTVISPRRSRVSNPDEHGVFPRQIPYPRHLQSPVRFLPLVLLLLVTHARAAEFSAQSSLLVRVWQSQDGLPGNVVRSVVQSTDGYLWVATAEGVARFDGFDFEVIEPEGELRSYRFAFSRLFATRGGDVWATTYQGGLFRVTQGRLHRILDNSRRPNPPVVTQLIEDPSGTVYFKRGSEYSRIRANGAVSGVSPTEDILKEFKSDFDKQLAGGRVVEAAGLPVLRDRMGRTWTAAAAGGLSFSAEEQPAVAVGLPQSGLAYAVNELIEDREGNIWLASPVNGLVRIRHARVEVLDTNEGQNERAVSALIEDHTGAWWIANRRGGLNYWTPTETHFIPLSTSRYFRPAAAIFEDQSSRLWVALSSAKFPLGSE